MRVRRGGLSGSGPSGVTVPFGAVAAYILAGGKSSRLYKKLVYELQIAQEVSSDQDAYALASIFNIQALARQGHTAAELLPAVPAIAVSARTGAGLDALVTALDDVAGRLRTRAESGGPARLHVDLKMGPNWEDMKPLALPSLAASRH